MKFTEILEELKKGEKVTREKWKEPSRTIDFIVYDQSKSKFMLYYNGNYHSFIFIDEDITAEDWKIYGEKETNKDWKPKDGDRYYYISTGGKVVEDAFAQCVTSDNNRVLFNNAFQTEKEAQHMLQKIQIITQLRKLSNISFNDDYNQPKFAIYYDIEKQEISYAVHHLNREIPFNIYFKTEEDCQNVIETIGEDNLKKYYFDVEE